MQFNIGDDVLVKASVVEVDDDDDSPIRVLTNDVEFWCRICDLVPSDDPPVQPEPPLDYSERLAGLREKASRASDLVRLFADLNAIDPGVSRVHNWSTGSYDLEIGIHADVIREGVRVVRERVERELRQIFGA